MRSISFLFIISLILVLFPLSASGDYEIEWESIVTWDSTSSYAYGVATDKDGNVLVTGSPYYRTVKLDASTGDSLWAHIDSVGSMARGIAVDSSGNFIVTGRSYIGGRSNFYTVKYVPSGNNYIIQWSDTVNYSSTDTAEAHAVAVDKDQNIIVTGYTTTNGNDDCYTIKYSPDGDTIWTRIMDNSSLDQGNGVASDKDGNIIIAAHSYILHPDSTSDCDYYTIKYDPSGTVLWTDTINNGVIDIALGVAVDEDGNIFVTGMTIKPGIFADYLTIKYDPSGTILWVDTTDYGGTDYGMAIATDDDANVIVTGYSYVDAHPYYHTVKLDNATGDSLWGDIIIDYNYEKATGVATYGNDIIITGQSIPQYPPPVSRFYTVKYKYISTGIANEDVNSEFQNPKSELVVSPNPFREWTEIRLVMDSFEHTQDRDVGCEMEDISLKIYDVSGRLVKDFSLGTNHSALSTAVSWDGTNSLGERVNDGIYFIHLKGRSNQSVKVTIVK